MSQQPNARASGAPTFNRRTLLRRAAAAGIVLTVGGLVAYREFLGDDDPDQGALGLLDDRTPGLDQPVPDFTLASLDGGEPISTRDFRGKTLLVNFWASWCPPCRAEMPDFQQLWEQRRDRGDLAILAVDLLAEDTVDAASRFVAEFGLTFAVVADADASVADRYGLRGLPATFFIDRDGIVRQISLGPVFGNLLADGVAAADAGAAAT